LDNWQIVILLFE